MALSNKEILRHRKEGNVVIDKFNSKQLQTASYDVVLGEYYYRQQHLEGGFGFFNPYSRKDVLRTWGNFLKAEKLSEWSKRSGIDNLSGISKEDKIIWIHPGETILAHTEEFIGGKNCVVAEMRARSSMGRSGIAVCKCAGWGDIGYVNRWTMEITNFLSRAVPLVVGRPIAQMIFFETERITETYAESGRYQHTDDFKKLKRDWKPEAMLPRLYKDYE